MNFRPMELSLKDLGNGWPKTIRGRKSKVKKFFTRFYIQNKLIFYDIMIALYTHYCNFETRTLISADKPTSVYMAKHHCNVGVPGLQILLFTYLYVELKNN